MINVAMNMVLLSAFFTPSITAEPADKALPQLASFSVSVPITEAAVPSPVPAATQARSAQFWDAAAKAAYEAAQDAGGLTTFADLRDRDRGRCFLSS